MGIEKSSEKSGYSLLSDKRIIEHMGEGNIVIDPFLEENLGTASYDVSLGRYHYREQGPDIGRLIYSPWSEEDVRKVWGEPKKAVVAGEYFPIINTNLPDGINNDDEVIMIGPGETILSHTEEFLGGRNVVTTMMKARSTVGRNFIEVCKCAGWGDVGYINRWTMEITNNSMRYIIPLVVGRRVAQMAFFEVGVTLGKDYSIKGKYQTTTDLEELRRNWKPDDMLPKMWRDREVSK